MTVYLLKSVFSKMDSYPFLWNKVLCEGRENSLAPSVFGGSSRKICLLLFSWTEMQLQMIKRAENKLPMRLKSGLPKLYIIKHFLGEDYSSYKVMTTGSCAWIALPPPSFFQQDLLCSLFKTSLRCHHFLEAPPRPPTPRLLSWLPLLCCFCTLRVFIVYTGLWALWRQHLGLVHLCSLTPSRLPGKK